MSIAIDRKLAELCGYTVYDKMFPGDPVWPHVCPSHQYISLYLWTKPREGMVWNPSESWDSLMFVLNILYRKWDYKKRIDFSDRLKNLMGLDEDYFSVGAVIRVLAEEGPEQVCRAILEVECYLAPRSEASD